MEEKELVPLGPPSLQGAAQSVAGNACDLVGQRQHIEIIHDPQRIHGRILDVRGGGRGSVGGRGWMRSREPSVCVRERDGW